MMRTSTFRLSGEFVAESCGGRLVCGTGLVAEAGASIDSRTLNAGQAFFAVRGPRFDGHDFLVAAVDRGAIGLVVDAAHAEAAVAVASRAPDRVFVVAVEDTTGALIAVARAWVEVLGCATVAVTGSVGKTTTKDLLAAAIASRYEVHATGGNLNNRYGLPLTCLKLVPRHEVLVAEMGMSAKGEIAELASIVRPRVGVVTCVAPVHLETLGSMEAIADAKAELVEALPAEGVAVLNADDPLVAAMRSRTKARVTTFGTSEGANVRIVAVDVGPDGRAAVTFEVGGGRFVTRLGLVGAHHAHNAAAALAAALALDVDPARACDAFASVGPGRHRMAIVQAGTVRLVDDCYNASPRSVAAALEALKSLGAGGRRVAMLGDMLELGAVTVAAHREAGRQAASSGVDLLIAVGKQSEEVRQGAMEAGMMSASVFTAPDAMVAANVAVALLKPRDTVLVKGSRGVGLEVVVDALVARFGADGEGN
jgi:UDP-N-acetylmuramoyl-tripeptide--D-alanyl-D-alanine ligase